MEAWDLLAQVEDLVLELELRPDDADRVNRLFRIFHTLKGSGAMFGFEEMAAFTHHVETVLDQVRSGQMQITKDLIDAILGARDQIKRMLEGGAGDACGAIVTQLRAFIPGEAISTTAPAPPPAATQGRRAACRIQFRPHRGIFQSGLDPAVLIRELRGLGDCSVALDAADVPPLDAIVPDACYLAWSIRIETSASLNAIKDVFIFVEDESDVEIRELRGTAAADDEAQPSVASCPESNPARPRQAFAEASTNAAPSVSSDPPPRRSPANDTVRVSSDRLDRLVNLVGELVINHSRFSQLSQRHPAPELGTTTEELERLVSDLREIVLGIRMMPIGGTFNRFRRLVRDLSAELGKEVDLLLKGEETELDKTVIDQLSDPLVHLIRNSIDHGIEPPAERVAAGKNPRGAIHLEAAHEGAHVKITVRDDGRGLDADGVRTKAIERRLIAPDARVSERELLNLVFLPGFSTAKAVTNVSGRGVGMDVVKRQIESLRGKVCLSSERGSGSAVTLTLPLTLAIIEGLLVELGSDRFVVPMSVVTENVELHRAARAGQNGRNLVSVRGELVPYVRLRDLFEVAGEAPEVEKIVIARQGDDRVGLAVDRVLGSHQTVIQPLGRFYRNVGLASGATILGDGRVALILDLAGLVRYADDQYARGDCLGQPPFPGTAAPQAKISTI